MPVYDGSLRFRGVFGGQHPLDIAQAGFCPNAVNRTFRGGALSRTRPRYSEPDLIFASAEDQEIFERGVIQGGIGYRKTSRFRDPGVVIVSSGEVFFGRLAGRSIFFTRIFGGLNSDVMHVWLAQAEERVYAQDARSRPMAWSGRADESAYSVPQEEGGPQAMPVGTCMAYAHGRILVCSESGQVAASDHISSSADRKGPERFTENTAFFGGTFSMPSVMGQPVAIAVQPAQEQRSYHGVVVVLCENGAASLDISGPRFEVDNSGQPTGIGAWQDAKALYVGPGFASHLAVVPVNNDLWARRVDGIQTIQSAYQRQAKGWTNPVLSRPVEHYLAYDTPHLLQFIPMGYHDHRVFCGIIPTVEQTVSGVHRFCRGAVVADLLGSAASEQLTWEGVWTGPSPILYLSTSDPIQRMFVVSRHGGKNRIFEQETTHGYDPGGLPIRSFVDSPAYEFADEKVGSSRFLVKELYGAGATRIITRGKGAYESHYRGDDDPCWHPLTERREAGVIACPEAMRAPSVAAVSTFAQQAPAVEIGGQQTPSNMARYFQIRHLMEGDVEIVMSRIKAESIPDSEASFCDDRDYAADPHCCGDLQLLDYQYADPD